MPSPFDPKPFQDAGNSFRQSAANSLPSQQSLDTASARVRSRLEGVGQAQRQGIQDRFSGSRNAGALNQQLAQSNAASQQAIATGLADVEKNFQDQLLQGAQNLAQVGQGQTSLGTAQTGAELGLGTLGVQQQQANTAQQQVANQLALGQQEVGVAQEANRIKEVLGQAGIANEQEANRIAEQLGTAKNQLVAQGLSQEQAQSEINNLLDLMTTFGGVGATTGTPVFNQSFQSIINALFGELL